METKEIFGEEFESEVGFANDLGVFYPYRSESLGKVLISESAFYSGLHLDDNNYKVCSMLREYNLHGKHILICLESQKQKIASLFNKWVLKSTEDLLIEFPIGISTLSDRILKNLHVMAPKYGQTVDSVTIYDFYSRDAMEQLFFLELLKKNGLLDFEEMPGSSGSKKAVTITVGGWQRLEQLEGGENSDQVFVAMSFVNEMDKAYVEIEKACRDVNLKALRIDTKEHNNEIVGEIQYEIKRSKFLIADVTGQRQGVYFEAGYAMGINIPVIWTCKKDDFSNVHFDASHYNHITWVDEPDLHEKLVKRIKGTILI